MKKLLNVAIVLLSIAIGCNLWLFRRYRSYKEDAATWEQNAVSLLSTLGEYKVKDSLNAVKAQGLNLEISDLKKLNSSLYADIRVLKAKNQNLSGIIQSISETHHSNIDTIYIPIKTDTIGNRYADLHYTDGYFDLNVDFSVTQSTLTLLPESLQYTYTDTLTFATSIKYKRFWYTFWKRTPIGVEIDAYSKNPNSKITGISYINLK